MKLHYPIDNKLHSIKYTVLVNERGNFIMLLGRDSIISGDAGHNCYPDSGFVGIRSEEFCTANIWNLVMVKLIDLGYEVIDCTPWNIKFNTVQGSLGYRAKKANYSKSNFHISIHLNSGGGNGVEAWICDENEETIDIAKNILANLSNIGYENRGIKNDNVSIAKYTQMPTILLKCGFVDSREDMRIYDEEKISDAITLALVGEKSSNYKKDNVNNKWNHNVMENCNNEYNPNAVIKKEWLYIRDDKGEIIPEERIDINTDIEVIGKEKATGLLKVIYPTVRGVRIGYIKDGKWVIYK